MKNDCCCSLYQEHDFTNKDIGRVVKCHECGSTHIVAQYGFRDALTRHDASWIGLRPNVEYAIREKPDVYDLINIESIASCGRTVRMVNAVAALICLAMAIFAMVSGALFGAMWCAAWAIYSGVSGPWV